MSTCKPRLTVIGTGYLGATHAICMAVLGYEVLAYDTDHPKVEAFASGRVPFHEPGLPEMLRKALDTGRHRFTTDVAEAGAFGDVHFLCTGTPQVAGSMAMPCAKGVNVSVVATSWPVDGLIENTRLGVAAT